MIAHTRRRRDKLLLRVLYATADRVSELCGLIWADVQPNGDNGQITLYDYRHVSSCPAPR